MQTNTKKELQQAINTKNFKRIYELIEEIEIGETLTIHVNAIWNKEYTATITEEQENFESIVTKTGDRTFRFENTYVKEGLIITETDFPKYTVEMLVPLDEEYFIEYKVKID